MSDPERKRWIIALLVTALVAVSGWGWGSISLRVKDIERENFVQHGEIQSLKTQYVDIKELLKENNELLKKHMGLK